MKKLYGKIISTPLGDLQALATEKGICFLEFKDQKDFMSHWRKIAPLNGLDIIESGNKHLDVLEEELSSYFSGDLQIFKTSIDVEGTLFQKQVWDALESIPFGKTTSYAAQATLIENPKAVRAVANAIGQNRISILIPCHRVIGTNGKLTGYAGGLWRKEKLLKLEKENLKQEDKFPTFY